MHVPPVSRTYWVTDTVVVPPDVNKVPASCSPSASWAAVHWPPAAADGVVAGEVTDGVEAGVVVAPATRDGDWLGDAVPATAEPADGPVVTDGWTGPPPSVAGELEQPAVSVTATHATAPATQAVHSPPRIFRP